jgi:hypothetical protein
MIKRNSLAGLLVASACSLPALVAAQPAAPPPDSLFFVTTSAPLKVDVLRGEGVVPGGVVKDKPYAADSITESTQVLADGNRITHRNQSRFYRDSQGRTRREQTVSALGVFQPANDPVTMITINDPVAEAAYFLDPVARTARQLQPFRIALDNVATFERAVPPPGAGALPFPPPGAEPGAPAVGVFAIREPGPGNVGFGPGPAVARFAPMDSRTEDLGKQVLEGVLAHGTRETVTIPTGAVGNERPIEISTETWYSDELEAVVLSKTLDPRVGETSYRLVNVVRGEPAPDLFAVPQGYQLQTDAAPSAGVRVLGPGEPPPSGARVERRTFLIEQGPPKPDK